MQADKTFQLWHVYQGIGKRPVRIVARHVGKPGSACDYVMVAPMENGEATGAASIYPVLANEDTGKEWLVTPPERVEDAGVNRDGEALPELQCIEWCADVTDWFAAFPEPETY